MISIIILAAIAIFFFYGISIYNRLVKFKTMVQEAWSSIDVMLKKRHDLIPNLVETVKGYATHERETFESVTRARTAAMSANTVEEKEFAEKNLNQAMMNLNAVAEQYPDLKANESFQQLMDELAGTENRIAVARKDYNDVVAVFNRTVKRFPGKIVASIFGFDEKEYFKAVEGAQQPPTVDFGDDKK